MWSRQAKLCRTTLKAAVCQMSTSSAEAASKTHFGARTVPKEEKESLVREVFTSVASNYDLMNDLMSGGLHRLWKDDFVRRLGLNACARAMGKAPRLLDVAGGTGDIAFRVVEELIRWLPPPCVDFACTAQRKLSSVPGRRTQRR